MATQRKLPGTKPTHRMYHVTGEGKTAFWRAVGAAWPNRDGQGFSIDMDAIPLKGRLVMREITDRPERMAGQ